MNLSYFEQGVVSFLCVWHIFTRLNVAFLVAFTLLYFFSALDTSL